MGRMRKNPYWGCLTSLYTSQRRCPWRKKKKEPVKEWAAFTTRCSDFSLSAVLSVPGQNDLYKTPRGIKMTMLWYDTYLSGKKAHCRSSWRPLVGGVIHRDILVSMKSHLWRTSHINACCIIYVDEEVTFSTSKQRKKNYYQDADKVTVGEWELVVGQRYA